jgi:hypothetical protein
MLVVRNSVGVDAQRETLRVEAFDEHVAWASVASRRRASGAPRRYRRRIAVDVDQRARAASAAKRRLRNLVMLGSSFDCRSFALRISRSRSRDSMHGPQETRPGLTDCPHLQSRLVAFLGIDRQCSSQSVLPGTASWPHIQAQSPRSAATSRSSRAPRRHSSQSVRSVLAGRWHFAQRPLSETARWTRL